MIKRILLALVAISFLSAAIMVAVGAGAFALYVVLVDDLGPAGAAGIVALIAAAVVALAGLVIALRGVGHGPPPEPSTLDRVAQIAQERPVLAVGAALLAGLIALKNPRAAAGLASAFLAGKAADKAERHHRRW